MMKNLIAVLMVLSFAGSTKSFSQQIQQLSKIDDLGEQVKKQWEVIIPVQQTEDGRVVFAILKRGIAVLSPDGQKIYCYDFSGKLIWGAPGIQIHSYNGWLMSTPDGEFLVLRYPNDEIERTIAVYNSDGQLLWRQRHSDNFSISPSGKYLINQFRGSVSRPLIVLDIKTGERLWQIDHGSNIWDATAGENDKIAHHSAGVLKFIQLESGKVIWEKKLEYDYRDGFGEVHASASGNIVSYDGTVGIKSDAKRVFYFFDENGDLVWHREQLVVSGSNGGRVKGISSNGEHVIVSDISRHSLFDIRRQKELWTISKKGIGSVFLFTKELLIFRAYSETELIYLQPDGTIQNRYTMDNRLSELRIVSENRDTRLPLAIVVKQHPEDFIVSRFDWVPRAER